jgi:hypothetical protein
LYSYKIRSLLQGKEILQTCWSQINGASAMCSVNESPSHQDVYGNKNVDPPPFLNP